MFSEILSDQLLIDAFLKAKKLNLHSDFIKLLLTEITERGLLYLIKD